MGYLENKASTHLNGDFSRNRACNRGDDDARDFKESTCKPFYFRNLFRCGIWCCSCYYSQCRFCRWRVSRSRECILLRSNPYFYYPWFDTLQKSYIRDNDSRRYCLILYFFRINGITNVLLWSRTGNRGILLDDRKFRTCFMG